MPPVDADIVIDFLFGRQLSGERDSDAATVRLQQEPLVLGLARRSSHSGPRRRRRPGEPRPTSESVAPSSLTDVTDALREVFGDHDRR